MNLSKDKGTLFVVSGPSGTGKGTIINEYFNKYKDDKIFLSISATTRAPRDGEVDGVNYYYKSQAEFEKMILEKDFLEWATFCGNYYGTPKSAVEKMLDEGVDVILEIEVQGAMKVKSMMPQGIFVFVLPPSFEELRNRIVGRNTETEDVIKERLITAKKEVLQIDNYNYILLNDNVVDAVDRLNAIISAERCRVERNTKFIGEMKNDDLSFN